MSSYLPDEVYDAEADIYPYKDASHLMFECSTLLGASEETVTILSSILTDILPPESCFHALFWASPKIGPMIDEMERQRNQGSEVLKELAHRRAEFYRKGVYKSLTKESHFILRDFRLFLSISVPRKNPLKKIDWFWLHYVKTFRTTSNQSILHAKNLLSNR